MKQKCAFGGFSFKQRKVIQNRNANSEKCKIQNTNNVEQRVIIVLFFLYFCLCVNSFTNLEIRVK